MNHATGREKWLMRLAYWGTIALACAPARLPVIRLTRAFDMTLDTTQ